MKGRFSVFVFFWATLFAASSLGSFQVSSEKDRPVYTKKQAGRHRFEPQQPNSDLFSPYETYWVGSWPEAVAIGDVSGDGRNDVVMTTSYYFDPENDYKVFVFRQSPDGQLLPPEKYDGGNGRSVDIGDFNHDGRNDLVVPSVDGIGLLLQNSAGRLDPMILYPIFLEPHKVRGGDFNADGRADVVAVSWGGGEVFVFLQNAGGTLNPAITYSVVHDGYEDLEAGDINNDGLSDIIVLSGQGLTDFLGILYQRAQGGFELAVYPPGNVWPHGVAVGDLNGDSRNDLAVANGGNWPSSHLAVFIQDAAGLLDTVVVYDSYDIPEPAVIGDVSGDGRPDAIVAHGGWTELGVYVQDAAGTLMAEELYDIPYASHYNPHGLDVGDINSDGRNDVVIADYNNGLVLLFGTRGLTYTLSIDSSEGGTTDPSPGLYPFEPGTEVSITAYPQSGHRFVGWTGDEQGTANPLTIIMDSHKSIKANFAKQYALDLRCEVGGTTDPPPGIYPYDAGSEVVITAVAGPGFRFGRWTGSVTTRDNPVTLTMNSDKVITAHFIHRFRLTLSAGSGGTTNPPPGSYTYDNGTAVRITAVPAEHYQFFGWSGSLSGSTNPAVVIMDSDKSIEALFQRALYPPLNFSGVKMLNRSLSQAEYVNVLSWQANPLNGDIEKYRVYLLVAGRRSLLAELTADTFRYNHRKVEREKSYEYWLVAVDRDYREGEPARTTVQ